MPLAKRQKRSTGWGAMFALVSHDLTEEMALERAKVIREKISQPYQIYDSLIQIGACIGIVISDGESRTDYLYKCADLALYEAKKRVPATFRYSVPTASAPAGE
jgi:GGDEF domain-containing protein